MNATDRLVDVFQEMYEHTLPECASCRIPFNCCSPEYCALAEKHAREDWGVDLTEQKTDHPTLPFMGEKGCVIAPHFRPLCTLHTCDINGFGFKMSEDAEADKVWTDKYWQLRDEINELSWEMFEDGKD